MSRNMTDQELNIHCGSAVSSLQSLFAELSSSGDKMKEKAMKLAYWVKDYVRFLRREDAFSPQSVLKLSRGTVVSAEFGFRLGSELGGRHYAVVIDAKNSLKGDTVTVVPLGSLKETTKENRFNAILEDGLSAVICSEGAEIKNLKDGTVARVNQITTISKLRIYNPPKEKNPLYGVKLTEKDMEKIDNFLMELYFKK